MGRDTVEVEDVVIPINAARGRCIGMSDPPFH